MTKPRRPQAPTQTTSTGPRSAGGEHGRQGSGDHLADEPGPVGGSAGEAAAAGPGSTDIEPEEPLLIAAW